MPYHHPITNHCPSVHDLTPVSLSGGGTLYVRRLTDPRYHAYFHSHFAYCMTSYQLPHLPLSHRIAFEYIFYRMIPIQV